MKKTNPYRKRKNEPLDIHQWALFFRWKKVVIGYFFPSRKFRWHHRTSAFVSWHCWAINFWSLFLADLTSPYIFSKVILILIILNGRDRNERRQFRQDSLKGKKLCLEPLGFDTKTRCFLSFLVGPLLAILLHTSVRFTRQIFSHKKSIPTLDPLRTSWSNRVDCLCWSPSSSLHKKLLGW